MRQKVFITGGTQPASCHASTIEADKDGRLWSACFAGTKEGNPDTGIWMAKQVGEWSPQERVFKMKDAAHWNPVLFRDPKGGMHIFFKIGLSPMDWVTYHSMWRQGTAGAGWMPPLQFGVGIGRGPVRSKPIVLSNGHWLAPCSLEIPRYGERFSMPRMEWTAHVERTEDAGASWTASENMRWEAAPSHLKGKQAGVIQPTLWESSPGRVHMLLRSTIGKICRCDSEDYGKTWSGIKMTDLPNPNSGVDVVRLDSGLVVLAYNHCAGNWIMRTPLSLAFSTGEGRAWSERIDVESGPHNYSYPALVAVGDKVSMTYTNRRRSIDLVDFTAKLDGQSVVVNLDGKEKVISLPT